jgi:glutaredoxin 3
MTNVTIYHKDYCPYCKAAIALLKTEGVSFKAIEVTSNTVEFANMVQRSNRRTVPQIFVADTHVGGFDDLQTQLANNTFPLNQLETA